MQVLAYIFSPTKNTNVSVLATLMRPADGQTVSLTDHYAFCCRSRLPLSQTLLRGFKEGDAELSASILGPRYVGSSKVSETDHQCQFKEKMGQKREQAKVADSSGGREHISGTGSQINHTISLSPC